MLHHCHHQHHLAARWSAPVLPASVDRPPARAPPPLPVSHHRLAPPPPPPALTPPPQPSSASSAADDLLHLLRQRQHPLRTQPLPFGSCQTLLSLGPSEFQQLPRKLLENDNLRYWYNTSTSQLGIRQCMPGYIHDAIQPIVIKAIMKDVGAVIPPADHDRLVINVGSDVTGFSGRWAGSLKQPDLAIWLMDMLDQQTGMPNVVFEVGFSETYPELLQDVDLWLCGSAGRVQAVVIVCLDEGKVDNEKHDADNEKHDANNDDDADDDDPQTTPKKTSVGPITAFLEIWRYSTKTGKSRRDLHIEMLPTATSDTFALTYQDLFHPHPIPSPATATDLIHFDLNLFRSHLEIGAKRLAFKRELKRKRDDDDGEFAAAMAMSGGGESGVVTRGKRRGMDEPTQEKIVG